MIKFMIMIKFETGEIWEQVVEGRSQANALEKFFRRSYVDNMCSHTRIKKIRIKESFLP